MNPDLLLAHFDRISGAPDAVPSLRRFILDLAVRGKLAEQKSNDESVSALLAQNDQLRTAIAEKDRRADANRQVLLAAESTWDIPPSWTWGALADVALFIDYRGKTPSKTEQGVRLITAKNVKKGTINSLPEEFLSEPDYHAWMTRGLPREGDILFTTEAPMGNAAVVRGSERFALAQRVICFRLYGAMVADFLTLYLLSEPFQSILIKTATGLTAKGIKAAKLTRLPVAVPPLAEQRRIVATVNELMELCDRLETARNEQEHRRDRLVSAALHHLNNCRKAEAVREHAHFYINHLPTLTTRPGDIKQLRRTIHNLAVCGQLLPSSRPLERPRPLSDFAKLQNGYAFKSEWFVRGGIRLLRNANVSHGIIRWDDVVFLSEDRAAEFERFRLNEGDIVLSLDRPFIVTGTKVARLRPEDTPCILLQRVGRFQVMAERLSPDYLFLWLHSPHFTGQIDPGRSNGVPHISSTQVEAAEIFVPPLTEQHRTVAKVNELMALCDRLERQLSTSQAENCRLLAAVLHHALATPEGSSKTLGPVCAIN
jgi:type I restriction enzyme S subunit